MKQNVFVFLGLKSSPFLLNRTIKIHASKYLSMRHYTDIVKELILSLYLDDSTISFSTIGTAIEFYEKSKTYKLQKLATNSVELNKFIDSNEGYSQSKMNVSDSEAYLENL